MVRHAPALLASARTNGTQILADVERVQVDDDDLAGCDEVPKIDRRTWLADDVARHATRQILVDLGLDRVDNLKLVATFERFKVAVEPLTNNRIPCLLH